ncbi:ester cyclase, partial [Cellulosimicrobium funkei]
MGTHENKAAAVAVHTHAIPGNHADAVAALLAPGFRNHDAAPGGDGGDEGLVATMHWYADAFEDQHVEVLHAVAEGDLVALHVELSARHTGYFRGVAPTGRRFRVREMAEESDTAGSGGAARGGGGGKGRRGGEGPPGGG